LWGRQKASVKVEPQIWSLECCCPAELDIVEEGFGFFGVGQNPGDRLPTVKMDAGSERTGTSREEGGEEE